MQKAWIWSRKRQAISTAKAGWSELPAAFMELVERSMRLQARVRRMDREVYGEVVSLQGVPRGNPVSEQIVLLKTAFGAS